MYRRPRQGREGGRAEIRRCCQSAVYLSSGACFDAGYDGYGGSIRSQRDQQTAEGLAKESGDKRFAYDSYRRFIQMARSVLGVEHHHFEDVIEAKKLDSGINLDTQLKAEDGTRSSPNTRRWSSASSASLSPRTRKSSFGDRRGVRLVDESARGSPTAGFMRYRRTGTAVNVQAMVFGNSGR